MNNLLNIKLNYNQAKELSEIIGYSNTRPFFGSLDGKDIAYVNIPFDYNPDSMKKIFDPELQVVIKIPLIEYTKSEAQDKMFEVSFFGPFKPIFKEIIEQINGISELYTDAFFDTLHFKLLDTIKDQDITEPNSVLNAFYGVIYDGDDDIIIYSSLSSSEYKNDPSLIKKLI